MPRPSKGPQLKLYGPDTKHGAQRRAKLTTYRYYAEWYEHGKRREYSLGIEFGGEPHQAFQDFLADRHTVASGKTPSTRFLIADALKFYADLRGSKVAAPATIGYHLQSLVPFFDGKVVDDISEGVCGAYVRHRENQGVKPQTAGRELRTLRAAVNLAKRDRKIDDAPHVYVPKDGDARRRWLTRSEALRFLAAARSKTRTRFHLRLFFLIGVLHGQREEAILGLRWEPNRHGGHVDLETGYIDFNPEGGVPTAKRRPRVQIARSLRRVLAYARKRTDTHVIEFQGSPIKSIDTAFERTAQMAGLEGVTIHTLRHTCITWLLTRGETIWDASGFVGVSPDIIIKHYGHHALGGSAGVASRQ
jgi:site-specific recombinase XerD